MELKGHPTDATTFFAIEPVIAALAVATAAWALNRFLVFIINGRATVQIAFYALALNSAAIANAFVHVSIPLLYEHRFLVLAGQYSRVPWLLRIGRHAGHAVL